MHRRSSSHSQRSTTFRFTLLALLCLAIGQSILLAQDSTGAERQHSNIRSVDRYALHEIVFAYSNAPGSSTDGLPANTELLSIINSRACDFSITSRMLRKLTYEAMANNDVPDDIVTVLQEFYTRSSLTELRYFDKTVAGLDVYRLRDYFSQIGFHDVRIHYDFHVSLSRRHNVLSFHITPGKRYSLDTVVIIGIDSLNNELAQRLRSIALDAKPTEFNEPQLRVVLQNLLSTLHDNSYAFARVPLIRDTTAPAPDQTPSKTTRDTAQPSKQDVTYVEQMPTVAIDTSNKRDSLTIFVEPLKPYIFGSTLFIDSTRGYPFTVENLKRHQLAFSPGDPYSLSALRRSEAAIYSLGPYERVAIDTTVSGDSILTRVFCLYKRVWDAGANIFVNNTFPDNFTNIGIDALLLDRNLFHDAQSLSLSGRTTLRDLPSVLNHWIYPSLGKPNYDYELETTVQYGQPDVTVLFKHRIDVSLTFNAYDHYIVDPFSVSGGNIHVAAFTRSSDNTKRYQVEAVIEAEKPKNFTTAYESAFQEFLDKHPTTDTASLRSDLNERLDPYKKLDTYTDQGTKSIFQSITSISMTASYSYDNRNDIFFPSRGSQANMLIEVTPVPQLTNFIRVIGNYYAYGTLGERLTDAFKIRAGHILWLGFGAADSNGTPTNSYTVPSDRGFFAGGASSIRSFASRQLGNPASNDPNLPSNVGDLANYVGWATVIELSAELRYTFPYIPELGDFVSDKVRNLGLTFFTDIGNAFNRLTPSAYGKAQFKDILNPVNYAWAIGTGIRYTTPAGPIRIDLGYDLYDPMQSNPRYNWPLHRKFIESLAVQLSLGHAF